MFTLSESRHGETNTVPAVTLGDQDHEPEISAQPCFSWIVFLWHPAVIAPAAWNAEPFLIGDYNAPPGGYTCTLLPAIMPAMQLLLYCNAAPACYNASRAACNAAPAVL